MFSQQMFRSTMTVSLMTLLSRITGLIRDIAFAQFLGSGLVADAFFVAFRIPNFFRRIFAEGAFSAGFVPVYAEYESRYPSSQVRVFLDLMLVRIDERCDMLRARCTVAWRARFLAWSVFAKPCSLVDITAKMRRKYLHPTPICQSKIRVLCLKWGLPLDLFVDANGLLGLWFCIRCSDRPWQSVWWRCCRG